MLRRYICCLTKTNNITENNLNKNNNDINGCITDSELSLSHIRVMDTLSFYDSNEWLNKLENPIDWKDCMPFVPPIDKGIVIKVYDGNTITIASKLPYHNSLLYRFSVRLNGIDCPEMKSINIFEKECAQIAKNEMINLTLNKVVTLKNIQTEKYGRILADVYIDDLYINNYLLEKKLAVSYDGGTKKSPNNWLEYYYKGKI